MSDLYWLSDAQMAKLEPFFPKSHGKPRVDDKRVLSGIIWKPRRTLLLRLQCFECSLVWHAMRVWFGNRGLFWAVLR